MLNLKRISFLNWFRYFRVLMLVAALLPTDSASAQDFSPYEKQMPANGMRGRVPTTHSNFSSFSGPNLLLDPSFEASYGSNAYWGQYSTNFGTPLCIVADCDNGGGTAGPRTGSVWGWLGGTPNNEVSDLYQYVTFPSCGATLQFYLWIGFAAPGSDVNDYFGAAIDGNLVFSANATQKNLYPAYTLISVDVSAYANGGTHLVEFFSSTSGQAVTFNLDDVALITNCTISGNAGAADVTLSYTDTSQKTVTASVNGSYSLPVSYNWSGTVTPSHPCFTFNPSSQNYSNVIANQASQNFTATFNAASGCANIDVSIAGANQGKFGILPGGSTRASFAAIDNGPVKVSSANSMNILAALRVIWKEPGFRASYSEMMGLPVDQLSTEYWFPWYNNAVFASMDQGFRIGNVNATSTSIQVWVGTTLLNSFTLDPGASTRVSYNVDNGPIRIVCTDCSGNEKIIAALRVIWKEPGMRFSYSEMMGLPKEQLSSEYWFPWYNNAVPASMDQGFRIANVSSTEINTIEVWVGTTLLHSFSLNPGASTRVGYGVDNGPIKILCTTCTNTGDDKIIAALRVIWKEPGFRASYSEMMGLPKEQLSTEYWFPWYNNAVPASMDQGFRIANVSPTESNTVDVWVGTTKLATIPLAAGASTRVGYNVDNGPIRIVCTTCTNSNYDQILAALRVIWKEPGYRASYSEMMGLPNEALSTEYWFPWYNFAAPTSMDQGFRIAVP